MIASIKSDLLKILTVRSTYFMTFLALLLVGLTSFYFEGLKANTGSAASARASGAVETIINSNASIAVLFISIIAILFMAHEYRYNTIMYTLTSNASRTKVFLSKAIVTVLMALTIGTLVSVFGIAAYLLGVKLSDHPNLAPQDLASTAELFRTLFYFVCYGLIGLLIAVIVRSLVGALAFYFMYPTAIEELLRNLVFKNNAGYLPFKSFDGMIGMTFMEHSLSPSRSAFVAAGYILVIGIIAWLLFLRRDAN